VFFGNREAVMVNLYGNLQKFLDNYTPWWSMSFVLLG
jgi:hypothetical protein